MNLAGRVGFCRTHPRPQTFEAVAPVSFIPPVRIGDHFYFAPAEDQGQTPRCVAFGFCDALQASAWRTYGYPIQFDEQALYADCKAADGDPTGAGTYPGVAVSAIASGCPKYMSEPHPIAGIRHHVSYSASDIPWLIHRYGCVVAALMTDGGWSYPRASDGLITLDGKPAGGHCQVIDGYDLSADGGVGRVFLRNWWGPAWGCQTPGYAGRCALRLPDLSEVMIEAHGIIPIWADAPQ